MKRILLYTVVGGCLCWLAGCSERPQPQVYEFHVDDGTGRPIGFKLVDKGGCAALEFEHWVVVCEAVPANTVPVGMNTDRGIPHGGGTITEYSFTEIKEGTVRQFTIHSMSNGTIHSASLGDLKLSAWNKDSMTLNGCSFKFTDDGKRLVFADHTYVVADPPRLIVIGTDGKTREQDNK